ncbi:oligosaccharyl transferase delta subunit [Cylindrobasidium torrendii FP15055 ss-10]|uniref:Ribophorin II n=1 Tax=Cylindrobasidium torrendii FP15055 ss-10 TaxID=1314674 RepID=A0A0D7AW68_9AGAR|nr:oligosaccharyl transferase delta subunit [Cylindrobasidium torrendii FP15055 ss-10]
MLLLGPLLFLAAAVNAAGITLQSPRLAVTASDGETLRSEPLSLRHKALADVTLNAKDTLKITFQAYDSENSKGFQPQQTFLRFYDRASGEEGIQPLRVTPSGKVKFELNMARPPASLPATTEGAPVTVSLILGHPGFTPLHAPLFDLVLPASQPVPVHPEEHLYHVRPAIEHTFRPDPKQPPRFISAVTAALVFAPWVVLAGLWSTISPKVPRLFSPSIIPFTATLAAFEVLLVWYWVALRLGDVLLYGSVLGLATVFTGKQALSSMARRRLSK